MAPLEPRRPSCVLSKLVYVARVPFELGSPHHHGGLGVAVVEEQVDQHVT
jgi:hypothetical protein